jgi:hypothetical protein
MVFIIGEGREIGHKDSKSGKARKSESECDVDGVNSVVSSLLFSQKPNRYLMAGYSEARLPYCFNYIWCHLYLLFDQTLASYDRI